VNWRDPWGLDKELTLRNIDPTPRRNEIVSQPNISLQTEADVGHTWLSLDDKHRGWGRIYNEDPSTGRTVTGALLDDEPLNRGGRAQTSSYTKIITDEQADAIEEFYTKLRDSGTGYNLGGSAHAQAQVQGADATMCTESVINALKYAGALTQAELRIITAPYAPWVNSYPSNIPEKFEGMAPDAKHLTSPNPNEFEYRIEILNIWSDVQKEEKNNN
jgi:hypothetical protein